MRAVKIALTAVVLAVTWVLCFVYAMLDAMDDRPERIRMKGTWPVGWLW